MGCLAERIFICSCFFEKKIVFYSIRRWFSMTKKSSFAVCKEKLNYLSLQDLMASQQIKIKQELRARTTFQIGG